MKAVTTEDIERMWLEAFSVPAKARRQQAKTEGGAGLAERTLNLIYNGGDLTLFAQASQPDTALPGMDAIIGRAMPSQVARVLVQYTGMDLAEVKDYDWKEPVNAAYRTAGVKLSARNDGMMTPIILSIPEMVKDPSGLYLSRFLIGEELTADNLELTTRAVFETGRRLHYLAENHKVYDRIKASRKQ